nr:RNA-directed DNA polymerase, eukaryota [Tanacetum cinerariifolium]
MARAKELFAWTLIFLDHEESEYISDDESLHGEKNNSEKVVEQQSEDPFCIYDMLNKKPKGVAQDSDSSLSHPPGLTPEVSRHENDHKGVDFNTETYKVNSPLVHTKVMNNSQEVHENVTSNGEYAFNYSHNAHNGGSILEVFDDMIWVGQSMGYAMEGCLGHKTKKKWVKELNIKHKVILLALQETKMDRVNHMDVKFIWGNSNYQYVSSDSAGSSGRILCVWEATIFKQDYATVTDNFIAIYGTWISNNSKVLIVVIYAIQSLSHKRVLWDYISSLIARRNGGTIVMGDFNEVRSIDERFGSMFNQSRSRFFNHFITSSGLVIFLKSIPPGINETDCDPEEDIHLVERLLYDNSSPRPPKEFVSENSNAEIESFSQSPIPIKDSNSFMEEIDLSFNLDDPMPPGIEEDDYDSERDILILKD